MGAALLLGAAVAALGAIEPLFLKYLTDLLVAAVAHADREAERPGLMALGLLGAVLLLQRGLQTAQTLAVNRVRFASSFELSSGVLRQIYSRPLSFHQQSGAGYVLTRVDRGVAALGQLTHDLLQTLVPNLLTLAMMMALLWHLSPQLAWVGVAPMPLFLWATVRGARRVAAHEESVQTGWSRLYSRVTEVLSGIKTVKTLGGEAGEVAGYCRRAREIFGRLWKLVWIEEGYGHLKNALALTGRLGVAGYGLWLALQGQISTGTWIAACTYATLLYGPLSGLAGTYNTAAREWVAAGAVLDFLEPEPASDAAPDAAARLRGRIEFDQVSFRTLHGLSFEVTAGEHIALVGPSGGGKTSLVDLLLGLHAPEAGRILLDGRDLKTIRREDLRSQMAVVLQEPLLLGGTIAENLGYGMDTVPSTPELWRALEAAQAAGFVAQLPEGLETRLGERGTRLSGGERQRLAIARALLRDPRILIFDEASAHLDSASEAGLNVALNSALAGRTAIIISHRVTTLPRVDRVFVLAQGQMVVRGRGIMEACPPPPALV